MRENDTIICIDVVTYMYQLPPLLVVQDCENINNITTIQGQKWECGWCPPNEKKLSGWNATKYLFRACKIPVQGVRTCYGQIPPVCVYCYQYLYESNLAGKQTNASKYYYVISTYFK